MRARRSGQTGARYHMLTGKIALITGASRGIGKEIAKTLARDGAFVIINYNGSQAAAEAAVKEIEEAGGAGAAYPCNVADYHAVEAMMKAIVAEYGHLDILVNNAGIAKDNLIMKMKEEEFDDVISINLKGAFNTIKHISRQMLKQKSGTIINITSVSGILGNAGQANYAAAKAGMIGLTKTMARELAAREIRVNAIAPGFIQTEMTEKMKEEALTKGIEQIPFRRLGTTREIANVVRFLASEEASYITGQTIHVDGGMAI